MVALTASGAESRRQHVLLASNILPVRPTIRQRYYQVRGLSKVVQLRSGSDEDANILPVRPTIGQRDYQARGLSKVVQLRGGSDEDAVCWLVGPGLFGFRPALLHHTAVGLWAFSSTIAAGRARMDLLGCLVLAFISSASGATVRDLVLQRRIWWVADDSYLVTITAVSFLTFLAYPFLEHAARIERDESGRRLSQHNAGQILLEVPDAVGMAYYSVYGAYVAFYGCHNPEVSAVPKVGPFVGVLIGLISSCFGSLGVDLILGLPPRILTAGATLYTTPAILGSTIFTIWYVYSQETANTIGAALAITLAFSLRMAAIIYDLTLPVWLNLNRGGKWRGVRGRLSKRNPQGGRALIGTLFDLPEADTAGATI
eukprot:CAMPEP_0171939302 /NCGR_PEP_ID=MMETSP0993-20121228/36179_1 /TAXON_ID=483369 /ORGANISM="non described non described, Strain CCMP2098" /LENGTH=370 /DNA_ID=CAMNT_0012581093 /DNA_START=120 /DNA_END=1232 /DNA_ORIENTATION=-